MTDQRPENIEERLAPYVQVAGQLQGKGITTGRTLELSRFVGSPHQRLRVVHVAGTSGKTSTSYYIAALLQATGSRTGLTVSPHMDSVTERVQLDGRPISLHEFSQQMHEFLELIQDCPVMPTYFELMMVFALWVFDRRSVDYAVIETGLGGLHDSSNICERADKIAVITDIGLDHTHILGDTLPEIARQKLGIVHERNTIITHMQSDEIMSEVVQAAAAKTSQLIIAKPINTGASLARFQRHNWSLARAVFDYIVQRDGLNPLSEGELSRAEQVQVPGRMDVYQVGDKAVVIDGAHNQQKMTALVDSFEELYPEVKPVVIVAVKQGKDIEQMAPTLARLASRVILTDIEIAQDVPHQSIPAGLVAETLKAQSPKLSIEQIPSNYQALNYCLDQPESVILIVGSLYLASTMRRLVKDKLQ